MNKALEYDIYYMSKPTNELVDTYNRLCGIAEQNKTEVERSEFHSLCMDNILYTIREIEFILKLREYERQGNLLDNNL